MYICVCHAVTEEQIKDFARKPGCTWRRMTKELKAGTDCGSCAIKAKRILVETGLQKSQQRGH